MKYLKKMLHFDAGGQVPGQSSSADTPGQSDSGNQAGTDTATASSTPGQSQAYNSATSAGTQTGSQQAGQASAQSGQSVAPTYSPVQTGSGFTNIQKLIGANTNNQLGNAVGGGVTSTAQNTTNNINNAQNDFTTQSAAANNNTDANKAYVDNTYQTLQNQAIGANVDPTAGANPTVTDFNETPSSITNSDGSISTPATTPAANATTSASNTAATTPAATATTTPAATSTTSTAYQYPDGTYAPTTDDQSKFNTFLSGQYNGPTQLGNLTNLQTQASDVNNLQNSLNSQEGRQGLLQRFVGGNSQYTQGQQNLDALLLGQTGGQQLSQARLATQGMPDINNLSAADQGVAQTYQNQAQDLANYVKTGAATTGGNIQTYLNNLATTDQGMANTQLLNLQNDVLSGQATPEESAQLSQLLGVSGPAYGQRQTMINDIFGSGAAQGTLGTGGTLSAAQYNANNVANNNQYASQQALQQLTGLDPTGLGLNIDQSQIGTASTTPIVTDATQLAQLQAAQAGGSTQFNNALSAAGLSLPEYQYLTGQDSTNAVANVSQAYNNMYNTPNFAANFNATGATNAPLIQQAIDSLQGYDSANGSTALQQYIQQLQGVNPANITNGNGLDSYQTPLLNVSNALTGLQSNATNLGNQNNYFSSLAALLGAGGSPPTNTGPGRQIIPR